MTGRLIRWLLHIPNYTDAEIEAAEHAYISRAAEWDRQP